MAKQVLYNANQPSDIQPRNLWSLNQKIFQLVHCWDCDVVFFTFDRFEQESLRRLWRYDAFSASRPSGRGRGSVNGDNGRVTLHTDRSAFSRMAKTCVFSAVTWIIITWNVQYLVSHCYHLRSSIVADGYWIDHNQPGYEITLWIAWTKSKLFLNLWGRRRKCDNDQFLAFNLFTKNDTYQRRARPSRLE